MGFDELVENVEQWAFDRDLLNGDPKAQFLKVAEEFGEIAEGLAKGKDDLVEDAIGDTLVTLIILARQCKLSAESCLWVAYNEIKNRKGKTIGGIFVKESDLQD